MCLGYEERKFKGTGLEGRRQGKVKSSSGGGDGLRCGESVLDERKEH